MTPWLSVVGLGEDGLDGLTPLARDRVQAAELLVGGSRHLALVGNGHAAERLAWETPLSRTVEAIARQRGRRVVVLATGDPMWFGIGVTLARRFDTAELEILPAVGAFSLAAARLGWPLAEIDCLTLHGRPLDRLARHLAPQGRLLLLAHDGDTPAAVAAYLAARGWGGSRLIALEHLGGPAERRLEGDAGDWPHPRTADLVTLAVTLRGDVTALSGIPGLPDQAYEHDGQLTKAPIRAATLAALAPLPGQLLWDVGAGSGSVAVEWCRAAARARAVAIERQPARCAAIRRNADALGVPELTLVEGEAPQALAGLAAPDAIFLGGGVTSPGLVEHCLGVLRPGGRLVANVVTIEGEAAILAAQARHGGELLRFQVSRAEPVGPFHGWRPLMPVTQWVRR